MRQMELYKVNIWVVLQGEGTINRDTAVVWTRSSVVHMWKETPRNQSLCWRQYTRTDAI